MKKLKAKKRDLIEILNLNENRAGFITEEGFSIRHVSTSDGDFLKNLNNVEKLLVAYKIGFVDGEELATYSLMERMEKGFEEVEKKVDKDRENENCNMYR